MRHLQSNDITQAARTSPFSTQKKIKMKNPCNEFATVNAIWNALSALAIVNAPNTHVRPSRQNIPVMLDNSLTVPKLFTSPLDRLMRCLTRVRITTTNMTALKEITRRIGPKKAAKNAGTLLMKQLKKLSVNATQVQKDERTILQLSYA